MTRFNLTSQSAHRALGEHLAVRRGASFSPESDCGLVIRFSLRLSGWFSSVVVSCYLELVDVHTSRLVSSGIWNPRAEVQLSVPVVGSIANIRRSEPWG